MLSCEQKHATTAFQHYLLYAIVKNNYMFKITRLLLTAFVLSAQFVMAQHGVLKGTVRDTSANEGIIGATVFLEGTSIGTATDTEGNYVLSAVPAGTYNLIFSSIGYKTKKITGVKILAGKVLKLNVDLELDAEELGDVVIIAARETDSDISVIEEIKSSEQVVNGISAEQISRSQDRDAAQVLTRVPGVTITQNRFVNIRGVGQRYNAVMLNGVFAPSTEVDIRSFSFDLIPSNVIDRMLVYKSGSADLPGDFAGGVIKLYTRNAVNENATSVTLGTGYRANSTFQKAFFTQGSSTDFLGFDNGFRSIPNGAKNINLRDLTLNQATEVGKTFKNNFAIKERTTLPDMKFGMNVARKFKLGGKQATNFTTLSYSATNMNYNPNRFRYNKQINTERPNKQFDYRDQVYNRSVNIGVMSNFKYYFTDRTVLEFNNMFNQLSDDETIIREGVTPIDKPGVLWRNYSFQYVSRSIYSGQLQLTHKFNEERTSITGAVGMNYVSRNEPDMRRFRSFRPLEDPEAGFILQDPASGTNLFDMSRFYSNLSETQFSNGITLEHKFAPADAEKDVLAKAISVKGGYYVDYRNRMFEARYFTYSLRNKDEAKEALLRLPAQQAFANDNLSVANGFSFSEGTDPNYTYTGLNTLVSGFAALTLPIKNLNIAAGTRVEHNIQELRTFDGTGNKLNYNFPVTKLLPFTNISYSINDKNKLRASYSRTLNRPEFRELAPFLYYDFAFDANIFGNPNLKVASIDNVDLRYEFYPNIGEMISFGVFYKYFRDPIESKISVAGLAPQFSFINADYAFNYGAELEVRKSFADLISAPVLNNMSVILNAAYIVSEVDLGSVVTSQNQVRALQGQSPYVINAGLYHNGKVNVAVMYNVIGPRIFAVGDALFPTVYEMPRHAMDLTVSKSFGKHLEMKFGIQDLLNFQYRFYQDTNEDGKIKTKGKAEDIDDPINVFRRGSYYNLSVTYKF